MANGVVKTIAALCAQADADIADNTQGDISPADVRNLMKDIIASVASPVGGMHISVSAFTAFVSQFTFVKAAGTTVAFTANNQFSMPSSNRLQYTGPLSNRVFLFNVSITITASSNNQLIHAMLVKNGNVSDVESVATIQEITHGTGTEANSHPVTGHFTLSTNDFIELFISNESGTSSVTVKRLNMNVDGKLT